MLKERTSVCEQTSMFVHAWSLWHLQTISGCIFVIGSLEGFSYILRETVKSLSASGVHVHLCTTCAFSLHFWTCWLSPCHSWTSLSRLDNLKTSTEASSVKEAKEREVERRSFPHPFWNLCVHFTHQEVIKMYTFSSIHLSPVSFPTFSSSNSLGHKVWNYVMISGCCL